MSAIIVGLFLTCTEIGDLRLKATDSFGLFRESAINKKNRAGKGNDNRSNLKKMAEINRPREARFEEAFCPISFFLAHGATDKMFLSAAKRAIVAFVNPEPGRSRMAVSYQREYFADTVTEIAAFVEPHWAEVGTYQDEFDRVINYSAYQKLERDRKLLLYTARQDGALIGYILAVVSLDLHRALPAKSDKPATMARVASMLVYYIIPGKRGYAPALVKAYERELEKLGFHISNTRVKPGRNAADAFFTAMGYSPIEVTYSKLIGEAAHARGSKVA